MWTKKNILIVLLCISLKIFGQNENVFIDRTYWKTNPTIKNIDQKISEGHDISALSWSSFDAVSYALLEKVDNKTIEYLLSKDGNGVNKLTHDGRTYIFWAVYKDNLDIMKLLLGLGADTDIIDSHGYSLMNFAATTGQLNTKLYDFCIKNGADITKEKNLDGANPLLLVTPHIKDFSLINYFTSKGIDMKTTDSNGNGIFNYAAKAGNIPLMEYLLKQGITYKKLNKQGENAMIIASRGVRNKPNTLESFLYLEKLGISPNVITNNGTNPLHAIAFRGKELSIYNYFLSKGVSINQKNKQGNTPFLNASYMNDLNTVKFLYQHVKDINYRNKEGVSALTNAVQRNSVSVIKFLVKSGADVLVKDKKGNNLFFYLIKYFKPTKFHLLREKVEILSANGFDISQKQKNGNSLYHLAIETKDVEFLEWVYSQNIEVNSKNNNGITPLHKAIMTGKNDELIKLLIRFGADKTIKTDFDESSYELALENELLKKNATDINFLK